MTSPDPKARAIALDALQQSLGLNAADAEEAFRNAQHLVHVRELLSHEPHVRYNDGDEISECPQCGTQTAAHGRESFPSGGPTRRYCRVAAAWRALGDPRGAADIERAHEEALREEGQRANRAIRFRREYLGQFPPEAIEAARALTHVAWDVEDGARFEWLDRFPLAG